MLLLVLNSPIEETKYVSVHQHTIESIVDNDDIPIRNFYQNEAENLQTSKTLDEESKELKRKDEGQISYYSSKLEDELYDKIDNKIDENNIESNKHQNLLANNNEKSDRMFIFPKLDSDRFKRNKLEPIKKENLCTQKTEVELTPQNLKGRFILLFI